MRKYISILAVLFLFLFGSCTEYVFVPMGGGISQSNSIDSLQDLANAVNNASDGDRLTLRNVRINPSSYLLPITLNKDVIVTGSMIIEDGASTSSAANTRAAASSANSVFVVSDNASVSFSNLSSTVVSDSSESISSIVYVNTGKIDVSGLQVSDSAGKTGVSGIAIGPDATADNISIKNTSAAIVIDENNEDSFKISASISESNPSSSADITTGYEVTDQASFEETLKATGKARLTQDIKITDEEKAYILPSTPGNVYEIDLNGHLFDVQSKGCFYIQTETNVTFRNGNLYINRTDWGADASEASDLGLHANSSLTLDNVVYKSEGTAVYLAATESNMNVSVKDSTIIAGGSYGISTNASNPYSENITITVDHSDITANFTGTKGSTGIMLNVPGTLTVKNQSVITGTRNGITLRGGDATISDSQIITGEFDDTSIGDKYLKGDWKTDFEAPYAALLVGNRSTSYVYPTTCIVENSTITNTSDSKYAFDVYVSSYNGQNVTFISSQYAKQVLEENAFYLPDGAKTTIIQSSAG